MGKKFGDRRDGVKLRNIHAMHFVMPLMYPNRCDNEAFISERIDLTNINAYLEKKNADDPDYAYNLFQSHLTEDILGERRGYEEIQADTAFMEQYNGLEEYPHMQTTAVTFNTSTSTVIFKFDKDELDLGNPQMSLVLPYYKVKYADIEDTTDDYIHEFDGPFILNWEAVYE